MTQTPPRSQPPPSVPREVTARARTHALEDELKGTVDVHTRVLFAFELGSLKEHALGDVPAAVEEYHRALELAPGFTPALLALLRAGNRQGQPADMAELWNQLASALGSAADRATALCEAGILLYDRLGRPERAVTLFEQALGADPHCATAALLLEHHGRLTRSPDATSAALTAHAEGCEDRELAAWILCELALLTERSGEPGRALELLVRAAGLGTDASTVWSLVEALARDHGQHKLQRSAVAALASIWTGRGRHAPEREERERALGRAVAFEREAARQATQAGDAESALEHLARAVELGTRDELVRYEQALMLAERGDHSAAAAAAQSLARETADSSLASVLHVQAARSLRLAQPNAELDELEAAARAAPESAAATGAREDALLRARRFGELRDHLQARAERCTGQARSEHLLRAARVSLLELGDSKGAFALFREAASSAERPGAVLTWLWAAAVLTGEHGVAVEMAEALTRSELSVTERRLLRLDQYLRAARALGDEPGARGILLRALDEPDNAAWAARLLCLHAAAARDSALLARAHRALAGAAQGLVRAAHLGAAARALRRAGDIDGATQAVHELLKLAPDDAYALALLEESLLDAGAEREAAEVLRQAARAHADGQRRELEFLHAGFASEVAGDVDSAARSYDEAIGGDSLALAPRWALRRLAERSGDDVLLERALFELAQREARSNGAGVSRLEWGEWLAARGRHQEARDAFSAALGDRELARAAALGLCLLPDARGWSALKELALEQLIATAEPEAANALTRARIACTLEANPEAGRSALEQALAQAPNDPWLALRVLSLSRTPAERASALSRLAKCVGDGATNAELTLQAVRVAAIAHGQAASEDGLLRALQAVERAPGSLASAIALEETLSAVDDPESRALALGGRLSHTSPELSAPLLAAWARARMDAGHPADAVEVASGAVERDPQDLSMWELLREASRTLGDCDTAAKAALVLASHVDGAFRARLLEHAANMLDEDLASAAEVERCLRDALASDPQADLAFAELHDRLLDRGELAELLVLIEQRLESAQQPAEREDLRYERALVLRAAGRLEDTVVALEQVLAHDSGHAGAIGLLVETCTALGRFEQAVAALRRLARANVPDGERRLARLGAAEFLERKLGDLDGAATELEELLAHNPEDRVVALRVADIYERGGHYRKAVEAYRGQGQGRPKREAAEIERRAARILQRHLGAVGEAIDGYERALALDPLDTEALFELLALAEAGSGARQRVLDRFDTTLRNALQREPAQPELLRALSRLGADTGRPELTFVAQTTLAALDPDGQRAPRPPEPELRPDLARLSQVSFSSLMPELARSPLHALAQLVSRGLADPNMRPTETAARAQSEQRFEQGRKAMAERLGVLPLLTRGRAAQRHALRAGLRLGGRSDGNGDAETELLAKTLGKRLPRAERKQLAREVNALQEPEFALDDYLEALALACDRAGLLLADDPAPALAHVLGGQRVEVELLAMQPRAIELLRFWLAPELPMLRREVGWGSP